MALGASTWQQPYPFYHRYKRSLPTVDEIKDIYLLAQTAGWLIHAQEISGWYVAKLWSPDRDLIIDTVIYSYMTPEEAIAAVWGKYCEEETWMGENVQWE